MHEYKEISTNFGRVSKTSEEFSVGFRAWTLNKKEPDAYAIQPQSSDNK